MDEKNINDIENENENEGANENAASDSASDVRDSAQAEAVDVTPAAEEVAEPDSVIEKEIPDEQKSDMNVADNTVIEERPEPSLDECSVSQNEPSAYAFRWDYGEQKRYDEMTKRKNKSSRGVAVYATILIFTFLLAAALLVCSILFGGEISMTPATNKPMQFSDELALDALYDYCLPSYVAISVITEKGSESVGSGIVITEDGYISTNQHVVENAKKITVITSNGVKYDAKYIDGDEINDIAVIKVSAKKLTPAKLGSSSNTKVGERVMAIGTPYSISYAGSMTAGYVSGIERQYAVKNSNGTVNKILKLIQTDTSVNPGNSGGPLFNMNGEVIGVVVLKIAGSSYEGMGFAIPIDGVKDMIFDIIENGQITDENLGSAVQGAALGISGREVIEDSKYLLVPNTGCVEVLTDDEGDYIEWSTGLSTEKIYITDTATLNTLGLEGAYPYHAPCTGILVLGTSEGFDSDEKLQVEDVIISANGVSCDSMSTLQEMIFNSRVGDVLHLEIFRNEIIEVDVVLGLANSME